MCFQDDKLALLIIIPNAAEIESRRARTQLQLKLQNERSRALSALRDAKTILRAVAREHYFYKADYDHNPTDLDMDKLREMLTTTNDKLESSKIKFKESYLLVHPNCEKEAQDEIENICERISVAADRDAYLDYGNKVPSKNNDPAADISTEEEDE